MKAIVIACNMVSAVTPERLRFELDLPVLGVIHPSRQAPHAEQAGHVSVVGLLCVR